MGSKDGGVLVECLVKRVRRVEVVVGGGLVRADQIVVVVGRHLAGEHILAGVLVAAVAGKALLVAVVDHRHAAGKVHEGVRQLAAAEHLRVTQAPLVVAVEEIAEAPHVMVADKGRQAVDVRVFVRKPVVIGE